VKTPMAGKINRAELLSLEVDELKSTISELQKQNEKLTAEKADQASNSEQYGGLHARLTQELHDERAKGMELQQRLDQQAEIVSPTLCRSPLATPPGEPDGGASEALQKELGAALDFLISKKQLGAFLEHQIKGAERNSNPLILAARAGYRGSVAAILRLKDSAKFIRGPDSNGRTALQIACLENQAGIVEELLPKLSDKELNNHDKEGMTALIAACFMKRTEVTKLLISNKKIDIEKQDSTGATAMHWTCSNGDEETTKALVQAGASTNRATSEGRTPLHAAAWAGHSLCIDALYSGDQKAELTADMLGATPMHFATYGGHGECVRSLFKHNPGLDLSLCNQEGQGYGELALISGSGEAMKALLDIKMPPDTTDKDGKPLILAAAHNGHCEIVSVFLNHGTDKTIKETNDAGLLHLAAHGGHSECVSMLLKAGLQLQDIDTEGFTPLHCAAQSGNLATVQVLLEKGAEVNARTVEELLPCHVAACAGSEEVLEALLQNGGQPLAPNKEGWLPLHFAAQWGHPKIVDRLCRVEGANPNAIESIHQCTALHIAAGGGKKNCVTVLLEAGADKDVRDGAGKTPMEVALEKGNTNCAKLCGGQAPVPPSSQTRRQASARARAPSSRR